MANDHLEDARWFLKEANFHHVLAFVAEGYELDPEKTKQEVLMEEFEKTAKLVTERIPAGELHTINQKLADPKVSDSYRDQLQTSVLCRLQ